MLRTDYQPSDRFKTVGTVLNPSDAGWGVKRLLYAHSTYVTAWRVHAWPALA